MRKLVLAAVLAPFFVALIFAHTVRGQTPPPPPPPFPGITRVPPPAPCPPNCPATATPLPTATSTPVPTATPIPLFIRVALRTSKLPQGATQTVSGATVPGAHVAIGVKFPDGESRTHGLTAGPTGKFKWSFTQPRGVITHGSRTARITVSVTRDLDATVRQARKSYAILFAPVDITIEPRVAPRGARVNVWIHSSSNRPVSASFHFTGGRSAIVTGKTGRGGWSYTRYAVPKNVGKGGVSVRVWGLGRSRVSNDGVFFVR